jgi:N-acetylgalactosamine 4-sulfate 6-O-sulfotransferase
MAFLGGWSRKKVSMISFLLGMILTTSVLEIANIDMKETQNLPSVIENAQEKKGGKTSYIPYENFLLQTNKTWVFANLSDRYEIVKFLKDMPVEKGVPESIESVESDDSFELVDLYETDDSFYAFNDDSFDSFEKVDTFGDPNEMGCDESYCHMNGRTLKREMIKENPNDMFTILPPENEYLKEFKNPCWKGKLNSTSDRESLFCTPYFFIAGFTKAGTTDLFEILNHHVLVSSIYNKKEICFYDRLRKGRSYKENRSPNMDQPPISYTYFTHRSAVFSLNKLTRTCKEVPGMDVLFHGITMDASPATVWDNEFWETFHPGYKEPPITNADTIASTNPKAKLIFIMRDPMKRMLSAYEYRCWSNVHYHCDKPITPEKYHALVVDAVERHNSCLKNNTVRGCTYSTETHQFATHLFASIYHVYLADFLKLFPRDQLYFIQMEEHIMDLSASLNNLCDFLEIPRFPKEKLRHFQERDTVTNSLASEDKLPYVLPETTEVLEKFFRPYLKELVNLLGDEKWYWKRPH